MAELRRRLLAVLALLAFASLVSYPLAQPLLLKAKEDLFPGVRLVILQPQEAIVTYLKTSILIGFALTLPAMTYHLWAFLAPGLLRDERRMATALVIPSAVLFAAGIAFGYCLLLPATIGFLIGSAAPLAEPMISLDEAASFVTFILAALGLVFQMPLATWALARLGAVTPGGLAAYRRHAVVLIFLASGLITPDPGPLTQILLAMPMMLLYEAGILSAKLAGGNHARKR